MSADTPAVAPARGGAPLDRKELEEQISKIIWFHRIDLGNGIITPGVDDTPGKLRFVNLPERLDEKTVLDVGAWDGFFSFECERRGALRVVAADHFVWTHEAYRQKGFNLAREVLASKVEDVVIPVEDISEATVGTFDLVLFLGVLYHAQDPMRYLRNVRAVSRDQLILETHVDALDYARPAMVFYPGTTLANDPGNFWGPNPAAVEAMLKEVGFGRVDCVDVRDGRAVFHAFV